MCPQREGRASSSALHFAIWTLRDNFRRIAIPVSVARGCDPRQIRAILLKVAHDNPDVMTTPAPAVELEEFGADSLEFKLYAFIDLNKGGGIGTDLRIAILDAFDDAGIRSPLPRTDVTLRNIEWLREVVEEYASDSYNGRRSATGSSVPRHVPERDDESAQPTTRLHRTLGPLSA